MNKNYYFVIFLSLTNIFSSCVYSYIPVSIKRQFCIYSQKSFKIDTNLIHVNTGFYRDVFEYYRPLKREHIQMYNTNGKLRDTIIERGNNITKHDILFLENGLCLEGQLLRTSCNTRNDKFDGIHLTTNKWGAYRVDHDTIKVKLINRGYVNEGFWAEEKWYKVININKLQLCYIKKLNGDDFYKVNQNSAFDSIRFYPSEYFDLRNVVIKINKSWLLQKKWFWKDKEEFKVWKRSVHQ